ncbi:MAG: hypothetical protein B7Z31_15770, partial [Rhodobacterales bacterium 12-65-15]
MTDDFAKLFASMLESSQDMLRAFQASPDGVSGLDKLFPTMPANLMEMWFGRTFNRDGLDAKTRLLVT